jgi:hypothetical protein
LVQAVDRSPSGFGLTRALSLRGVSLVCWRLHGEKASGMAELLQYRIMQNGSRWYWEVLSVDHEVVAHGVADTQAQARADAERIAIPGLMTENVAPR